VREKLSVVGSFLGLTQGKQAATQRAFFEGVGDELLDTLKGLGLLLLIGAISLIPVLGPLVLVGFVVVVIVGLVQHIIDFTKRVSAGLSKLGIPIWAQILIGLTGPGLFLFGTLFALDFIGVVPLLEGIIGFDISGERLDPKERGKRVTRGVIDLALTFLTAGIARAVKLGAKGAQIGVKAVRASRLAGTAERLLVGLSKRIKGIASGARYPSGEGRS
jgi:hypothetical protein